LLLILHDLVTDGWSTGVLIEELSELYAGFAAGQRPELPEPALQFSDFARWQRQWSSSGAADRQFAYWRERLRDLAPVFPANNDVAGTLLAAPVSQESVDVSNDLVSRLRALSRSRGATLFMTLLAGFKALLLARTGQGDICVATSMANRSQLQTERVIGPIANTTIIRTQLDPDLPFQQALSRVQEAVLEAYARQELPFDILAARLAEHGLDPASLLQAYFVLRNAFGRALELPDVAVRPFANRDGQPVMPIDSTWLSLTLRETQSGIIGACCYKKDLFEPNTHQEHWVSDYKAILAEAAANPEASLGRLADGLLRRQSRSPAKKKCAARPRPAKSARSYKGFPRIKPRSQKHSA
jgi:Condensation domain